MIYSTKPENAETRGTFTFRQSLEFTLAPKESQPHPSATLGYWSFRKKPTRDLMTALGFLQERVGA